MAADRELRGQSGRSRATHLAGDRKLMADLRLASAELAEELHRQCCARAGTYLGDRARLDAAAEHVVEVARAGGAGESASSANPTHIEMRSCRRLWNSVAVVKPIGTSLHATLSSLAALASDTPLTVINAGRVSPVGADCRRAFGRRVGDRLDGEVARLLELGDVRVAEAVLGQGRDRRRHGHRPLARLGFGLRHGGRGARGVGAKRRGESGSVRTVRDLEKLAQRAASDRRARTRARALWAFETYEQAFAQCKSAPPRSQTQTSNNTPPARECAQKRAQRRACRARQ